MQGGNRAYRGVLTKLYGFQKGRVITLFEIKMGNVQYFHVLRYLGGHTTAVLFLYLRTNTGEWSPSIFGRFTPRKKTKAHWITNWVERRNGLEGWRREKSLDPPGIQTSDHPALNLVQYWLRTLFPSVAYGGGLGRFKAPPPRNSEGPPKSCQTQPDCKHC